MALSLLPPSLLFRYKESDDITPPPSSLFCCKEGDDKRRLFLSSVTLISLFEEDVAFLFFWHVVMGSSWCSFQRKINLLLVFYKRPKVSIWLFTKVFIWICRIAMSRKRKLKKVCCDWEVQEQNVVALESATKKIVVT
jgi:hypothetical protein